VGKKAITDGQMKRKRGALTPTMRNSNCYFFINLASYNVDIQIEHIFGEGEEKALI
jgi:hypothetical protein